MLYIFLKFLQSYTIAFLYCIKIIFSTSFINFWSRHFSLFKTRAWFMFFFALCKKSRSFVLRADAASQSAITAYFPLRIISVMASYRRCLAAVCYMALIQHFYINIYIYTNVPFPAYYFLEKPWRARSLIDFAFLCNITQMLLDWIGRLCIAVVLVLIINFICEKKIYFYIPIN